MAAGNGRSDSRVGEGGRLRTPGGEERPGDDRRDAKTASHEPHDEVLFTGAYCGSTGILA